MKQVIFAIALLFAISGTMTAQKANVKIVQKATIAENPNISEAIKALEAAIQDPTTKDDPETYNLGGRLYLKIYAIESMKAQTVPPQPYDTALLYNSVAEMFKYFDICDSLAQLPDAKGKMRKNKWREPNQKEMQKYYSHMYNGSVFYMQQRRDYPSAVKFWDRTMELPKRPILQDLNLLSDSMRHEYEWYATLSAFGAKDQKNVIRFGNRVLSGNHPKKGDVYDLISRAYREQRDTVHWIQTLEEAIKYNPASERDMVQLINLYNEKGNITGALGFAERLIEGDPNNDYGYFIKGYLLQNMDSLTMAVEAYKKAIELDPSRADYHANIGTCYIGIAQDLDAQKADRRVINQNYLLAKEQFESAHELAPDKENLWLMPLYRIYYILGIKEGELFEDLQRRIAAREGNQ